MSSQFNATSGQLASPTSVAEDDGTGSAGIFVERAGTRKIPLSGARYVFPKLTAFFTPKRALQSQDDNEMLRRNGRETPAEIMDALTCFRNNPNPPESRLAAQEQQREVMVACSKCGSYNMRSEENDAVHQPFYCPTCEMFMSSNMLGVPKGTSLETLEERTEPRDENSHLGVEDLVAMERELQEIAEISGETLDDVRTPQSETISTRSRSRSPPPLLEKGELSDPPLVPPSPIRRFMKRFYNLRSPHSASSDSEEATTASSVEAPFHSSE